MYLHEAIQYLLPTYTTASAMKEDVQDLQNIKQKLEEPKED